MRLIPGLFLALAVAAATGLGLTAASLSRGGTPSTLRIGPWHAMHKAGTTEADPYARAMTARLGTLPLALADGIALIAMTDSVGGPLDGTCVFRLHGTMPPARYWTVTVSDQDYRPVVAEGERQGFTSYEIVRFEEPADITIAPQARPGNWLPSGGAKSLRLILRLYDTPLATTLSAGIALPAITRVGCP